VRLLGPRLSRVPSWCSLSLRFSSLVPERTTTARSVCQGTYRPAGWSCIPRKADQGVEIGVNADTCPATHMPPTRSLRCVCSHHYPVGFTLSGVRVGVYGSIPE